MFIVQLVFTENKAQGGAFMEAHKAWLKQGFEDGVFLLAGSLQPHRGGCLLAHNVELETLKARLAEDPFVVEKIVQTEIVEFTPSFADKRLTFLKQ